MIDIAERVRVRIGASHDLWPVALEAAMAIDEQRLGFTLPPLLKRLYAEIGNGGWGPGYGLIGLTGGKPDDLGNTATSSYIVRRGRDPEEPDWQWPEGLLPICHWGCAIYSCVDCLDAAASMTVFDPNESVSSWSEAFFSEHLGFETWVSLWAAGEDLWQRLYGESGVVVTARASRHISN